MGGEVTSKPGGKMMQFLNQSWEGEFRGSTSHWCLGLGGPLG